MRRNERWYVHRPDWAIAILRLRVSTQFGAESFLVLADRLERLVQVHGMRARQLFSSPDEDPHQVAVAFPEAEPSPHLHQSVSSTGSPAVVRDCETFDG